MWLMPRARTSRSTASAPSWSAGGPKTCGPASCMAPYPTRVTVRSPIVQVPPGSDVVEVVMPPLCVAGARRPRSPLILGPAGTGTVRRPAATVAGVSGDDNRLGDYLRARREQVSPESVGIPVHGVRRVAGLRREEVAMLAGISADYYLRLEQGRDRNPSVQVLEAIAHVLQLDATATDYLLRMG